MGAKIDLTNSRTWKVFFALSGGEVRRLQAFLASPYHNQRQDVVLLFEALRKVRNGGPLSSPEELWRMVYPERDFHLADLRHLLNYLLKSIEEFLVLRQLEADPVRSQLLLIAAYQEHQLDGLAQSRMQKTEKMIDRLEGRGTGRILAGLQLAELDYSGHAQEGRSFRAGLQEISNQVDHWFVVQKLKHACTMLSQRKVFQADYEIRFLEEVLAEVGQSLTDFGPLALVYLSTYRMLQEENNIPAFEEQTKLLDQHGHLLLAADRRALYLMAVNFCIRQLNRGAVGAAERIYKLYQKGLAEGWLFEKEVLSPYTFKNVVSVGLKLGLYAEVEAFISDYRGRLPEDFQESFHLNSQAELQLAQGQWREVLRTLRFVQHRDPLTQLRSRIMQIKAGFELGELQLIEYQLDNLRQLLRRRKELAYHKQAYADFGRFLKRILDLPLRKKQQRKRLEEEILEADALAERDWLLGKLRAGEG